MAAVATIDVEWDPYLEGDETFGFRGMLVDGEQRPAISGRTFESKNPATGEIVAHIAEADAQDVDAAVRSARRAFDSGWGRSKPAERQRLLLRLADLIENHHPELARLDTLEMGGTISRMRGWLPRVTALPRYNAGLCMDIHGETIENSVEGDVFTYSVKEPVGVVAAITPWNGPHHNAIWKISPALAAGCTVVLKPSEVASLSAIRLGELVIEAGFPPGVVNVVTGYGKSAGAALAEHRDVSKIAFTGSTVTGQSILRASADNMTRVTLELGGKSPQIVFDDADLDAAVPAAAMGVFGNSGQMCIAGSRLFIQRRIYNDFVQGVAAYGSRLRVGNSMDPSTQVGPLASENQLGRVQKYLHEGEEAGAELLSGGRRLMDGALSAGFYIPPTVFVNARDDMSIMRDEIFGPVVCATPFDTEEEVITKANQTPYGLAAGIWTQDVGRAHRLARAIQAGTVWVNTYQLFDPAVPFGGYKMSGLGRESGSHHLDEYLETKAVWTART